MGDEYTLAHRGLTNRFALKRVMGFSKGEGVVGHGTPLCAESKGS